MQLLFIVCEANVDERVIELLTEVGVAGYTRFTDAFGSGTHGRREGSPVWPGLNSIVIAAAPTEQVAVVREQIEALQAEREGRLAIRVFAVPAEQLI
ncbi:MAG: hypothetical protein FJX72_06720 [Armatimonadetes bacterium]|nr:hypothetical protein [Armatimonadota bacterium]